MGHYYGAAHLVLQGHAWKPEFPVRVDRDATVLHHVHPLETPSTPFSPDTRVRVWDFVQHFPLSPDAASVEGAAEQALAEARVDQGQLALAARRVREKAKKVAAHLLEASPDDIEWTDHTFQVMGAPDRSVTMKDVAFAAYTNPGDGNEPGLEASLYYDPPNMTFPHGAYIAVVDVDADTGISSRVSGVVESAESSAPSPSAR